MECVVIDCSIFSSVAGNHSFDCLDAYLSSAIAVGECYGVEMMVDSPVLEELYCGISCEVSSLGMLLVAKVCLSVLISP